MFIAASNAVRGRLRLLDVALTVIVSCIALYCSRRRRLQKCHSYVSCLVFVCLLNNSQILRVKDEESYFPMVLVGNKCDLTEQREVQVADGSQLAQMFGLKFVESSAKTVR